MIAAVAGNGDQFHSDGDQDKSARHKNNTTKPDLGLWELFLSLL